MLTSDISPPLTQITSSSLTGWVGGGGAAGPWEKGAATPTGAATLALLEAVFLTWGSGPCTQPAQGALSRMSQNCPLLDKESAGDDSCVSLLPDWQTSPLRDM